MLKRLIDIICSALGMLVLLPIILIVAILVRVKLGSPILFRQQRPGRKAEPFYMIKFCTMVDRNGSDGLLLPDGEWLTRLGRWLRSTSLDELPGLWNVLRGDMSLVGPRPLLMQYLPLYSSEQARRHEVRPGLTGWAQVNGHNTLSWNEKFAFDIWCVDHQTLRLDFRIILMTVWKVFRRDGISAVNDATMPAFVGNEEQRNRG